MSHLGTSSPFCYSAQNVNISVFLQCNSWLCCTSKKHNHHILSPVRPATHSWTWNNRLKTPKKNKKFSSPWIALAYIIVKKLWHKGKTTGASDDLLSQRNTERIWPVYSSPRNRDILTQDFLCNVFFCLHHWLFTLIEFTIIRDELKPLKCFH